jgi:hypothetical protein
MIMSTFYLNDSPAKPEMPQARVPGAPASTAPAASTAAPAAPAAAPAPAPVALSTTDKQQTVENAKAAVQKIMSNASLSRGQKNGRVSIIKQRLREAGIDPKEAGL